jgi:hypothetical protein
MGIHASKAVQIVRPAPPGKCLLLKPVAKSVVGDRNFFRPAPKFAPDILVELPGTCYESEDTLRELWESGCNSGDLIWFWETLYPPLVSDDISVIIIACLTRRVVFDITDDGEGDLFWLRGLTDDSGLGIRAPQTVPPRAVEHVKGAWSHYIEAARMGALGAESHEGIVLQHALDALKK